MDCEIPPRRGSAQPTTTLLPLPPKHRERSLLCLRRGNLRKEASGALARLENDLKGLVTAATNLLSCAIKAA